MNKLLKFFIPKITIETLKFFGALIALAIVIKFIPINDSAKSFFTNLLLFVAFPLLTYFNRLMYLPTSIDWILLTPNKKIHIALAHGFINLFKIAFLFLLINIFTYVFDREIIFVEWYSFLFKEGVDSYSRLSVDIFVGLTSLFGLVLIFNFGILPNYVQNIQQRQNYKVKKTPRENLKSGLLFMVGAFLLMVFLAEDTELESVIPWFIRSSALMAFVLFGAIYSTLTTLRFYFSKKKFMAVGGLFFVLLSCTLYFYASKDILSDKLPIKIKIQSLQFLGSYSGDLDKEIEKEFLVSDKSLSKLNSHDLKDFFEGGSRQAMFPGIVANWEKLCEVHSNYTCRLAYYMHSIVLKKNAPLDLVRKSCPNDLGSCYVIYDHKEIPLIEQQNAIEALTNGCKNPKNELGPHVCKHFLNRIKKEKK